MIRVVGKFGKGTAPSRLYTALWPTVLFFLKCLINKAGLVLKLMFL